MAIGHPAYDAIVVGAGSAGGVAALELARCGARVAPIDKAHYSRDKACGDLIGPRGVALLGELGIAPAGAVPLGDMAVIGPSGGRIVLPAVPGRTYPGTAWALPRKTFDDVLYRAAIGAGAEAITARVRGVEVDQGAALVQLGDGGCFRADTVIGADGATSTVAAALDMVRSDRAHWGFAIRTYARADVELPVIILFDERPGVGFPGYGWLFPGPNGLANAGVGVGTGADRRAGVHATRQLDAFLQHLRSLGLLGEHAVGGQRLGGWLKMGMLGTTSTAGPVILVGDAAGLVNPLQGEGIAQALESGAMAASAIANRGNGAAPACNQWLRHNHSSYQGSTAVLHRLPARPSAHGVATREVAYVAAVG